MTEQERKIVAWFKNGEKDRAAAEVYHRTDWCRQLRRRAEKDLRCLDAAEDVVQETMITFWKKVDCPDFQLETSLRAYFQGIGKNKIFDQRSKIETPKTWVEYAFQRLRFTFNPRPDHAIELQDDERMVEQVLKQLGKNCWEIIQLKQQGYRQDEIAEMLGYSGSGSVKSNKGRCIKKLDELLREYPYLKQYFHDKL